MNPRTLAILALVIAVSSSATAALVITGKQIKATLPAPALLGERLWDAEKSKKAYPTREDFVRACVPILHHELELLVREGVDIVQIDDPHLCLFVDAAVRSRYEDADRLLAILVALGEIGDERSVDIIFQRLDTTDDEHLRARIVEVLEDVESPRAVDKLETLAKSDPSPRVRIAALEALDDRGDSDPLPLLREVVADPGQPLRVRIEALDEIGDRTCHQPVQEVAHRPAQNERQGDEEQPLLERRDPEVGHHRRQGQKAQQGEHPGAGGATSGEQPEGHPGVAYVGQAEQPRHHRMSHVVREVELHQPFRPLVQDEDGQVIEL